MGVLVVLLLVACIALAAIVVAQRRRIDDLAEQLADAVGGGGGAEVITIEIRNHGEVAASRTSLARPLARFTPGLLRGIVHRETVKMMRSELADNGVDADVRLRRLDGRLPEASSPSETDSA